MKKFFYELTLRPNSRLLEMVLPGFREIRLLRRRLPRLGDQYHSSDFLKHQHMHLHVMFEECQDRPLFGIACDVRPVLWEEERLPNPTYGTPFSNNSGDDRVERWLFLTHSVVYEIDTLGMSDDDYMLLLMKDKITTDLSRMGRGFSPLPERWKMTCSTMR